MTSDNPQKTATQVVQEALGVILPKDYSTFVEEESLYDQETKAGIRVVVYGYFVGMDTDDPLSVIRATNQLRENNPNVQQSYVVLRYDEELNGDPVVLDTATQGVFWLAGNEPQIFANSFEEWFRNQKPQMVSIKDIDQPRRLDLPPMPPPPEIRYMAEQQKRSRELVAGQKIIIQRHEAQIDSLAKLGENQEIQIHKQTEQINGLKTLGDNQEIQISNQREQIEKLEKLAQNQQIQIDKQADEINGLKTLADNQETQIEKQQEYIKAQQKTIEVMVEGNSASAKNSKRALRVVIASAAIAVIAIGVGIIRTWYFLPEPQKSNSITSSQNQLIPQTPQAVPPMSPESPKVTPPLVTPDTPDVTPSVPPKAPETRPPDIAPSPPQDRSAPRTPDLYQIESSPLVE